MTKRVLIFMAHREGSTRWKLLPKIMTAISEPAHEECAARLPIKSLLEMPHYLRIIRVVP